MYFNLIILFVMNCMLQLYLITRYCSDNHSRFIRYKVNIIRNTNINNQRRTVAGGGGCLWPSENTGLPDQIVVEHGRGVFIDDNLHL